MPYYKFIIIVFYYYYYFQVAFNDRLSVMICNSCIDHITTINSISGLAVCTNELMTKLLEKKDSVRKLC